MTPRCLGDLKGKIYRTERNGKNVAWIVSVCIRENNQNFKNRNPYSQKAPFSTALTNSQPIILTLYGITYFLASNTIF